MPGKLEVSTLGQQYDTHVCRFDTQAACCNPVLCRCCDTALAGCTNLAIKPKPKLTLAIPGSEQRAVASTHCHTYVVIQQPVQTSVNICDSMRRFLLV